MKTLKVQMALTLLLLLSVIALAVSTSSAFRRAQPSQPAGPGVATGVFEKGQNYLILFEEGLLRRWWLCSVQDAKDNWVKCNGGLVENSKITEPVKDMWFNTDHILRVSTK